jgi:hypothetical protein
MPGFEALDEISKIMKPFLLPSPTPVDYPPFCAVFNSMPSRASRLFPVQHIPSCMDPIPQLRIIDANSWESEREDKERTHGFCEDCSQIRMLQGNPA